MTGLVLEGGALRTIYSAGVTDGFLEEDIHFPYTIGVSAGIAYGVSYLSRQFGRNRDILLKYANDKRYMGANNMFKPGNHHCYFGLKFVYDDIPEKLIPFDYETYDKYCGRAEAVLTNMHTGEPIYKDVDIHVPDTPVLQATCALPILFPAYTIDGVRVMDGGIADPIPWQRPFEMGCSRVVVILTRELSYSRKDEPTQHLIERLYRHYPKFVEQIQTRAQRYNECRAKLLEAAQEGRVLLFAPENTQGFSRTETDTEKINALWEEGRRHAHERADEVRAFLRGE